MRLVLHDTLTTAPFTVPVAVGWHRPHLTVDLASDLRAADIAADDVALLPTAEMAFLQRTHQIVADAAVVAGPTSAIGLRVPVRPDEVERTPVRLLGVSGTAELLARATLRPFYGILPSSWTRDESADAQAVIVEGADALRPPEVGYAEDLCRAWFILTGHQVVTHVLAAPLTLNRDELRPALAELTAVRDASHRHRRELRSHLAQTHELDLELLEALLTGQRLSLEAKDRRSLLLFLRRGQPGSAYPAIAQLSYLEPGPSVQ